MTIKYSELYYASTQYSILSGLDGFGIRTHTQGLPKALIEAIQSKNIFYYTAGTKPLAGTFELIQQPHLVESYPKSYYYFKEKIQQGTYYVFARTIFLGRDYGWYLKNQEEGARSGNTFTHALFLEEKTFFNSIKYGAFSNFFEKFLPKKYQNNPTNTELRKLLTNESGKPTFLPHGTFVVDKVKTPSQAITNQLREGILAIYQSICFDRKVIFSCPADTTLHFILQIFDFLPNTIISSIDFTTNYHEYSLDSDYRILFLNEYSSSSIPENDPYFIIGDFRNNRFSEIPSSDFFQFFQQVIMNNEINLLQTFNRDFDSMLAKIEGAINLDHLFYAWLFLFERIEFSCNYDPDEVIDSIQQYPLTKEFQNKIGVNVYKSFVNAIIKKDHQKIANSLQLIEKLKYEPAELRNIQQKFTNYFFQEGQAAKLLNYTMDQDRVSRFLILDDLEKNYLTFLSSNKLPSQQMNFFILNFCIAKPDLSDNMVGFGYPQGLLNEEFGKQFEEKLGEPHFFQFMGENEFFVYAGREVQQELFGNYTKRYLANLLKKDVEGVDEAICFIDELTDKGSFFKDYLNYLTKSVLEEEQKYKIYLLLFNAYIIQIGKEIWKANELKLLDKLFDELFDAFLEDPQESTIKTLFNANRKFKANIPLMIASNQKESFKKDYYQNLSLFINHTLDARLTGDLDKLKHIRLPALDSESLLMYLQFILINVETRKWETYGGIREVLLKLFGIEGFLKGKYNEHNQAFTLLDYIPNFYNWMQHYFPQNRVNSRENIKDFHCTYTRALWDFRVKGFEVDKENSEWFSTKLLYNKITKYLKALKEMDRNLCKEVIHFLEHRMGDNKLTEVIKARVDTDSNITKIYKMFKGFRKPKK